MRKSNARQALVDNMFQWCMAHDERTLAEIRERIRREMRHELRHDLHGWEPTSHELQIMISRNAMGEGDWDYYPAYSNPPRYVSRARVRELCALAEQGRLSEVSRKEMREQLEDLNNGVRHWRAKHATARRKEKELLALVDDIAVRAFAGHHAELL